MIRTILSPGVEINEVDKSQYTPDVGALPRALIFGFASKGPNKTTTEITSMANFRTVYGTPTNEPERYFYNAVDSMIGAGATVVASKIPYSKDSNYVGIKYYVDNNTPIKEAELDVDEIIKQYQDRGEEIPWYPSNVSSFSIKECGNVPTQEQIDFGLAQIKKVDPTVTSALTIYPGAEGAEAGCGVRISDTGFLELESGAHREDLPKNSFIIVDKTKGIYKPFVGNGSQIDCLGILPVVTTAPNAMAIAYELSAVNMDSVDPDEISTIVNVFEPLTGINYLTYDPKSQDYPINGDYEEISSFWSVGAQTVPNANTLNSISKSAAEFFPTVTYAANAAPTESGSVAGFDHRYFSYIGIVVYKIGVDRGSGNLIAEPIESFAGSLLANAKDVRTNASVFIENIVNSTSNYISIYVNEALADQVDEDGSVKMNKNTILFAKPSAGMILGLPPVYAKKSIDFETISDNMDNVFKSQSNILASTLDVVVDAGLSTIGECVEGRKRVPSDPSLTEDNEKYDGPVSVDNLLILKQKDEFENKGPWPGWRAIINKFKKFCETTRKDCAFVCDSPRFFSLRNQRKLINPYDVSSSVATEILPKIRHISGVNTSYGWGYAAWFKIADGSDGTSFWCPPSIFGANRYIWTRTRWHVWDAPAGMTRGAISIDDTSFEPDLNARNTLYSNAWNYSLTDVRNGVTTLEGQKTFQSFPSAFDRINVRSLFLDVERRVFNIARNYVYEPNTADTRQEFVDNILPIFQTLKSEGGCYDYKIVADESINTPEVIDNNEFRVRIGLQPVKTIEFVLIDFVATRTGSNWSELLVDE